MNRLTIRMATRADDDKTADPLGYELFYNCTVDTSEKSNAHKFPYVKLNKEL